MLRCLEIIDDRAVGPSIAVTLGGQSLEGLAHCVQLYRLALEFGSAGESDGLYIGARPAPVVPQGEQLCDIVHAKTEIARPPDESQGMDVALVIIPVAGSFAGSRRHQPDFLIMADHALRHARSRSGFSDLHSRIPLRRSELPMTVTELSDMAAPAMIGESRILNQG